MDYKRTRVRETDRFDSLLEAGMIVEASGTERTLVSGVHLLQRLSEERQRPLHRTHVTAGVCVSQQTCVIS